MKIIEATRTDWEWILHHRIGMFTDMEMSEDFLQQTAEVTREYLNEDWTNHYRYFLVENNDQIIGGCGISTFRVPPQASQKSGVFAYLSNMFVEREHRRKGVGKLLLNHVIDFCRNEGIGLHLLHASNQGQSFYGSAGFTSPDHLMSLNTFDT